RVEVVTPEEFLGDVMGDLNARRGRIEGMAPRGNAQVVRAIVPLAEMFGYATDLRSMTQGRATYTMQFERYAPVPEHLEQAIVEQKAEQARNQRGESAGRWAGMQGGRRGWRSRSSSGPSRT